MLIEEHSVVTIAYELYEEDASGELLERMDVNYPFTFLFGTGALLPKFEAHLEGLSERNSFSFHLAHKDAYGPVRQDQIIDVPMHVFEIDGEIPPSMLQIGTHLSLTDDQGKRHNGRVLKINTDSVTIDFNHVMAGKNLYFKGVVLQIRPATIDEIVRRHYIPQDGIHL